MHTENGLKREIVQPYAEMGGMQYIMNKYKQSSK
jgi:hypothetical protein